MKQSNSQSNPAQDAVVAFFGLVRAVADRNRSREREKVAELDRYGFRVRVKRGNVVARSAVTP